MTATMPFDPFTGDQFRAESWDGFVGQARLKDLIQTHIRAATIQMRSPDHMLFCGKPGFGKTTLARLIAQEASMPIAAFTMPVKFEVVVRLVLDEFQGVLFLDEIHRLPPRQQEDYLTMVESNYLEYRGEKFPFRYVTIVAATTEKKKIIKPLIDRFPLRPTIEPYTPEDMQAILRGMVRTLNIEVEDDELAELAGATAGIPRRARDIALAIRDLQTVHRSHTPSAVFDYLRLDPDGLTDAHFAYLRALQSLGGEAGLRPLCTLLGEQSAVVEETETLLIEKNMISFNNTGRALRTAGYQKLSSP